MSKAAAAAHSSAPTPKGTFGDLFDLIRQNTTQVVVRDFLKANGAAHSGTNWNAIKDRVSDAIEAKHITTADLYVLLCDAEEHGKQHVFLQVRNPAQAAKWLQEDQLLPLLKSTGFDLVWGKPKVLIKPPKKATLVDARLDDDGSLVIKYVETREHYVKAGAQEEKSLGVIGKRQWVARWDIKEERAVSVIKVRPDGMCEVRIHLGQAGTYAAALNALKELTHGLIPWDRYEDISLTKVKGVLWAKKDELKDLVAFSNSSLHDDKSGVTVTASTARLDDDLRESAAGAKTIQLFIDSGAHVTGSSVYFKPQPPDNPEDKRGAKAREAESLPKVPARILHVVIRGAPNEFAIPVHCGKVDYEYVLQQLRRHNR